MGLQDYIDRRFGQLSLHIKSIGEINWHEESNGSDKIFDNSRNYSELTELHTLI